MMMNDLAEWTASFRNVTPYFSNQLYDLFCQHHPDESPYALLIFGDAISPFSFSLILRAPLLALLLFVCISSWVVVW